MKNLRPSAPIYGGPTALLPFVSIVIPTYRRAGLLGQAIASALAQSECRPYEVIVVDDDQSKEILEVVSQFPRDRIAVYQNRSTLGMWENLRQAVQLARGSWILVLCDDDLLMPGALSEFDRVLSFYGDWSPILCIAGGVQIFLDEGVSPLFRFRQSVVQYPVVDIVNSREEIVKVDDAMRMSNVPKLCSSFFTREGLSLIGWDSSCGGFADLALYLRIQRDGGLYCCKGVFGRFRVHDANASRLARLWETYPLDAAGRLLQHYVDKTTPLGRSVIDRVERGYFSSLWKSPLNLRQRSKFARSLSSLCAGNPARRYIVSQGWFFHLGWFGYALLRPVLHVISTLAGRVVAAVRDKQRSLPT